MARHRGVGRIGWSLLLLGIAINPQLFELTLEAVGLSPGSARLAAARLAVIAAFSGAGLFVLGVTAVARRRRIHRAASAIAASLRELPELHNPRCSVIDELGAVLNAEYQGIRMEVVVEPLTGGRAWVRAQSPTRNTVTVWPRGLAPAEEQSFRTSGDNYECLSVQSNVQLRELEDDLNEVFGPGEATHVIHDGSGIEVCMPNEPTVSRNARIASAARLTARLAQANR